MTTAELDFDSFIKKVQIACESISVEALNPEAAFLKNGIEPSTLAPILEKGKLSVSISLLINMLKMEVISKDEYDEQMSHYADVENPESLIDEKKETIWKMVMQHTGELISKVNLKLVSPDSGAAGGKEMLGIISSMYNKNADPTFAPSTGFSGDTSATSRDIMTLIQQTAQIAVSRDERAMLVPRKEGEDKQGRLFSE